MKKLILALMLMCPLLAHSLEIKFGLMQLDEPLYEGVYSDPEMWVETIDDTGLVGRIEIGHNFKLTKSVGINVFAMHMSLFHDKDPHYGVNGIGAELVFTLY